MKKMLEIFNGDNGELSSKRVIGILGAIILFSTLVYNVIKPSDQMPSSDLISAVTTVVVFCLGFTSIDKFANRNAQG